MDVLVLIDKLDDLVHNAKAVPLTGRSEPSVTSCWSIDSVTGM